MALWLCPAIACCAGCRYLHASWYGSLTRHAQWCGLLALHAPVPALTRAPLTPPRRRRHDGYTENDSHEAAGCGIHGTGAGFERVDKIETWVPPSY